jgi:putative PIN family toxin of toxin-antitoxin system
MRIILDSNIFISSFFWGGNPRKVMERIINGKDKLFICKEIIHEIELVLSRPKFKIENEYRTSLIKAIDEIAYQITLIGVVENICRDSEDDKILECALLAHADYIITGDNDLLTLEKFREIKIVTASEYLLLYPN